MSSVPGASELMETYLSWTNNSLQQMRALIEICAAHGPDPTQLDSIHDIAHNIKGMGASFGFPLMSKAGASLCAYLRGLKGATPNHDVLDAHLRSFEVIIANRIEGDGGATGLTLIDRLNQLVDRAHKAA